MYDNILYSSQRSHHQTGCITIPIKYWDPSIAWCFHESQFHIVNFRITYNHPHARTQKPPHVPVYEIDDHHRSTRSQQTLHHNIIAIYPFVGTQKSNCFPNAHGESLHVLRIVPHSSLHFSSFRPAGKGRGKSGSSSRALREVPRGEVHTHSHNEVKVSSPGTHAFIYIHASSQAAWDKQSSNRLWHQRDDAKLVGSSWDR
jgi:hypothetical protein